LRLDHPAQLLDLADELLLFPHPELDADRPEVGVEQLPGHRGVPPVLTTLEHVVYEV
jgi:hypothetical protein